MAYHGLLGSSGFAFVTYFMMSLCPGFVEAEVYLEDLSDGEVDSVGALWEGALG